jgi:hypothetical protein
VDLTDPSTHPATGRETAMRGNQWT